MDIATHDPRSAHVEQAVARGLAMLDRGATRREVLTHLASAAETVFGPRATCSILVLDREGLLRDGASPNLPADYLDAIDRLKPSPFVGTCAAAAATGKPVMTPDFLDDEKWSELRHLPLALGFVGAWSQPIVSGERVLGTFGTYFRERREPTGDEQRAIERLASVAAKAIGATA